MFSVSFNDVQWDPEASFPMSAKAAGPPDLDFNGDADLSDFGDALADFVFLEDGGTAPQGVPVAQQRPRSLTESESESEEDSYSGYDFFSQSPSLQTLGGGSKTTSQPPVLTAAQTCAPPKSKKTADLVLSPRERVPLSPCSPLSAAVACADTFDEFLSALQGTANGTAQSQGRVSPDNSANNNERLGSSLDYSSTAPPSSASSSSPSSSSTSPSLSTASSQTIPHDVDEGLFAVELSECESEGTDFEENEFNHATWGPPRAHSSLSSEETSEEASEEVGGAILAGAEFDYSFGACDFKNGQEGKAPAPAPSPSAPAKTSVPPFPARRNTRQLHRGTRRSWANPRPRPLPSSASSVPPSMGLVRSSSSLGASGDFHFGCGTNASQPQQLHHQGSGRGRSAGHAASAASWVADDREDREGDREGDHDEEECDFGFLGVAAGVAGDAQAALAFSAQHASKHASKAAAAAFQTRSSPSSSLEFDQSSTVEYGNGTSQDECAALSRKAKHPAAAPRHAPVVGKSTAPAFAVLCVVGAPLDGAGAVLVLLGASGDFHFGCGTNASQPQQLHHQGSGRGRSAGHAASAASWVADDREDREGDREGDHDEEECDFGFLGVAAGVAGDAQAALAFSAQHASKHASKAAAAAFQTRSSPSSSLEFDQSSTVEYGNGNGNHGPSGAGGGKKRGRKPGHTSANRKVQRSVVAASSSSSSRQPGSSSAAQLNSGNGNASGGHGKSPSPTSLLVAGGVLSASRRRCRAYVEGLKARMRELSAHQERFAAQQQAEDEQEFEAASSSSSGGQGPSSPLEAGSSLDFLDTAWAQVDAKEKLEQETVSVRQSVVEAFLQLRGAGMGDKARWKDLVTEDFTFSLPRTPYRAMPTNSNQSTSNSSKAAAATAAAAAAAALSSEDEEGALDDGQRWLFGVEAAAADAQSLGALCEGLRQRVKALKPDLPRKKLAGVKLFYDCGDTSQSSSSSSATSSTSLSALLAEDGEESTEPSSPELPFAGGDEAADEDFFGVGALSGASGSGGGSGSGFGGGVLVSGDKAMCHWKGGTCGLVACGFEAECTVEGLLRCTLDPATHKLSKAELTFDVLSFTRQLQRFGLVADPHRSALSLFANATSPSSLFSLMIGGGVGGTPSSACNSSALPNSAAAVVQTKGALIAARPPAGKVHILCAKPQSGLLAANALGAGGGVAGMVNPALMREMMLKAMGALLSKAAKLRPGTGAAHSTASTALEGSSAAQQPLTPQQMQMQVMMMAAAMVASAQQQQQQQQPSGGQQTMADADQQPASNPKKRSAPVTTEVGTQKAYAAASSYPSAKRGATGAKKFVTLTSPPTLFPVPPTLSVTPAAPGAAVSSLSTPPMYSAASVLLTS
eukprot:CAMPEP_0171985168 /NCGR_PEP_ID=MMETSP0993-20121228/274210_1 /TAXON_ID=483369 /ORGANISM="non described non described, Strain CCMP2098" /LENGTH=1370 /DNA_ID=CAMNT_0012638021 /DNA_START=189 /DNA_END=4302 /DNA_ORIENTATION=-